MSENLPHIVLVDDDDAIRELLSEYLCRNGYRVIAFAQGNDLLSHLAREPCDLLILDLMLPGIDGLSLCQQVRAQMTLPIIMLTAKGELTDKVLGLELGADDYLAKPFEPRELLARLRSQLRRGHLQQPINQAPADRLYFGPWILDCVQRNLIDPDGVTLILSSQEYKLLKLFIDKPQQVLSRDKLMQHCLGREQSPIDRAIDMQVSRLRQKLKWQDKNGSQFIQTVRQEGYRLATPVFREKP